VFVTFNFFLFFVLQALMPTTRELYDIERTREVKNIPLLKSLKAQLDEQNVVTAQMAQIRGEINNTKSQEQWDTYEKLQQLQLAQLNQQTYPTHLISTAGKGIVNTVVVQAISSVG
jgi:hypothetical protein